MSLSAGTRLGPYEILSPRGAGGMGEVYRARDSRLGREVAVKVLPERFANDAELVRRFEHEARAVAALSLGDEEWALAGLEEALRQRSHWMTLLRLDPRFDALRDDPRLQVISRRVVPQ